MTTKCDHDAKLKRTDLMSKNTLNFATFAKSVRPTYFHCVIPITYHCTCFVLSVLISELLLTVHLLGFCLAPFLFPVAVTDHSITLVGPVRLKLAVVQWKLSVHFCCL